MTSSQETVNQAFQERFGSLPELIVRAPGRMNLIGEHTDYNLGFVLPAAINKGIWMALSKNDKAYWEVHAIDLEEKVEVATNEELQPFDKGWANYVFGVVDQLQKSGQAVGPFRAVFGGNIPIGSGLSSSAALENATCYGLNELFGLGMNKMEMIRLSQKAEHEFVGVKCGIMDQFTSMMGQADRVIRLDCRSLEYETFPFELEEYELVLFNSNVEHNLASSEYNIRRAQCEEGVRILQSRNPGIGSLRDANMELLRQCRGQMPEVVYLRCKYVIEENIRVLDFCQALVDKDFNGMGRLLKTAQSGMKNEYEITCPEIDFLVDFAYDYPGVIGARMMGGGFGGCTLNIVDHRKEADFVEKMMAAYKRRFGFGTSPIKVRISDGVGIS